MPRQFLVLRITGVLAALRTLVATVGIAVVGVGVGVEFEAVALLVVGVDVVAGQAGERDLADGGLRAVAFGGVVWLRADIGGGGDGDAGGCGGGGGGHRRGFGGCRAGVDGGGHGGQRGAGRRVLGFASRRWSISRRGRSCRSMWRLVGTSWRIRSISCWRASRRSRSRRRVAPVQAPTAFWHDGESLNGGSGFEHQLPHWYSQVGVGVTVVVQRVGLWLVVDVVLVVELVVELVVDVVELVVELVVEVVELVVEVVDEVVDEVVTGGGGT